MVDRSSTSDTGQLTAALILHDHAMAYQLRVLGCADAVASMLAQQKGCLAAAKHRRVAAIAEHAADTALAALQQAESSQQTLK